MPLARINDVISAKVLGLPQPSAMMGIEAQTARGPGRFIIENSQKSTGRFFPNAVGPGALRSPVRKLASEEYRISSPISFNRYHWHL